MSPTPINLYDIYSKVCNRKNSGSIAPGARLAAAVAAEKASELIAKVSPITLAAFRDAERKWAAATGSNKKSYADEFESAIRSGNYLVRRKGVNNAWNEDYQPLEGFIYGAISSDRPGWMKLGATTEGPLDRLDAFAKHYGLKDICLMYHAHVAKPMSVENAIRISLREYSVRMSAKDSREWFAVSPDHAMQTAEDAIVRLGVKVFVPVVASRQMKALLEMKVRPVDYISYGGRLATGGQRTVGDVSEPELRNGTSQNSALLSGFSVGSRVFHKAKGQQYGRGVVVGLSQEYVTVSFATGERQFLTRTAATYLNVVG